MRKLVYFMMVSLDGFAEAPGGRIDPLAPDVELHRFCNQLTAAMGGMLYGRRLFEVMEVWRTYGTEPPTASHEMEFARIWRQKPKYVFSRTLQRVAHDDLTLVRGDAGEYVRNLKAQPGGDLAVGGPDLAASLIRLGMVDEFALAIQPVILGGGKPFLPPLDRPLSLRRIETREFASGATLLRYQLAPGPAA